MERKQNSFKIKCIGVLALLLVTGLILLIIWVKKAPYELKIPNQFALIGGIPYLLEEGIVYRYNEDASRVPIQSDKEVKQIISGENLCLLYMDGSIYAEKEEVEPEELSLTAGYAYYMGNLARELNEELPFACINKNPESLDFRALLQSGEILYQTGDTYEILQIQEEPVWLSGSYVLTQKGNI